MELIEIIDGIRDNPTVEVVDEACVQLMRIIKFKAWLAENEIWLDSETDLKFAAEMYAARRAK